ncbi:MAG TPA: alpha-1,2-fucosyltransferase [Candidatus Paceibacterota bacterium]|nr:alpha-1,2-fucosyltransferase [Candidatus Paceibacterota bacterium]
MITVRIHGGLGNQMFQYAFGRTVARRNHASLALDTSSAIPSRPYQLGSFAITARPESALVRTYRKIASKIVNRKVAEKHYHFYKEALEARDGSYLDGYWQSDKYFKEIEADIRKEFVPARPFGPSAAVAAARIDADPSAAVSVHIRRGDYASNSKVNAFNGTLSPGYYQDAVKILAKKGLERPVFYVFSDDMAWVKEHLPFLAPAIFVSQPGISDAEDLMLMSRCKAHIIANSTFSWWGAWLDPNPSKIVIGPRQWFRDTTIDTGDVIPEGWLTI